MDSNDFVPVTFADTVFFEVPEGSAEHVHRVTTNIRSIDLANTVDLYGTYGASRFDSATTVEMAALPVGDFSEKKLFDGLPLRGEEAYTRLTYNGGAGRFVAYGYVELDDDDYRQPNRPLYPSAPTSPFTIPEIVPVGGGDEVTVHTLSSEYADLVTLYAFVPDAAVTLEVRFYDGTYTAGTANYVAMTFTQMTAPERVLDRHPMLGPGSITAKVTVAPGTEACYLYGTVLR